MLVLSSPGLLNIKTMDIQPLVLNVGNRAYLYNVVSEVRGCSVCKETCKRPSAPKKGWEIISNLAAMNNNPPEPPSTVFMSGTDMVVMSSYNVIQHIDQALVIPCPAL